MGNSKILIVSGPSGVGKSSIIEQLLLRDLRFQYITLFTTRSKRDNETRKIEISEVELGKLLELGEVLEIMSIYGIQYGACRSIIENSFNTNRYPVVDWPISKVDIFTKNYAGLTYVVYVVPPSDEILSQRISVDNRDSGGIRYRFGLEEYQAFLEGAYSNIIDFSVVNENLETTVDQIYDAYTQNLD